MSVQDGKYEVYYINPKKDYIDVTYVKNILEENYFNLCDSLEQADFILDTKEFINSPEWIKAMDYSKIDCIEVAETLHDLLRLRDEAQFRGI